MHTSRRSRGGCLPSRAWIRLARGHYWLPDRDAERWQHRYTLSLARAVVAQRSQFSTAYLSHTSAALALELDMFSQEPDVYLCLPRGVQYPISGPCRSAPHLGSGSWYARADP
ncbi:hypothetical protein [Actinomyces naeslundii]|uniref:hypothetical protein n=1 Tax=Actinomyces naeslundii TaxID=1655 RepID=UPI003F9EBC57